MIGSPDFDFFDVVAVVIRGDTLAPYLSQDCVLWISENLIQDNGFPFKKKKTRSRRYIAETMIDAENADDQALHANTPAQAESPLYSLQQSAESIGRYLNAIKTECKCFKQDGNLSTFSG